MVWEKTLKTFQTFSNNHFDSREIHMDLPASE